MNLQSAICNLQLDVLAASDNPAKAGQPTRDFLFNFPDLSCGTVNFEGEIDFSTGTAL
jgi:hypothetical protein